MEAWATRRSARCEKKIKSTDSDGGKAAREKAAQKAEYADHPERYEEREEGASKR